MTRFRPEYRWQVDWAGNGEYDHPQSDISRLLVEYEIRYGCAPDIAPDAVVPATAIGFIVTDNSSRVLDPDSPNRQISVQQVAARNEVRLLINDYVWWTGALTYDRKIPRDGGENIRWVLDGRHGQELRTNLLLYSDATTLGEVLSDVEQLTTLSFNAELGSGMIPVADVSWDGGILPFLEEVQTYIGGFAIESRLGEIDLIPYTKAQQLPLAATFTSEYESLLDLYRRGTRPAHSRSAADVEYSYFTPDIDDNGNPRDIRVFRSTFYTYPGLRRVDYITDVASATSRPIRWTRFTASIAGTSTRPVLTTNTADPLNVRIAIDVPTSLTGLQPVLVEGYAERDVLTTGTKRLVQNTQFLGEAPVQQYPSWFNSGFDGVIQWVKPWLDVLAVPPQHIRVAYKGWQTTAEQSATVTSQAIPGARCSFTVLVNEQPTSVTALILQVGIRWRETQPPIHTVDAIITDDVDPRDLYISATGVSDTEVQVLTELPEFTGRTVYVRARTA